jgi:hypothetical protein
MQVNINKYGRVINMNQEVIQELQERCPIKFDPQSLLNLEATAKALHESQGKYLKEFYCSIYQFLQDVSDKLKQEYVIIAERYRYSASGISIVYKLPPAKASQKVTIHPGAIDSKFM